MHVSGALRWPTRVNANAPLLEVRGLHVGYPVAGGLARAVDGVDLSMGSGEILALVGESGCGKTTLARTIMGLRLPDAGEVLVRGEPLGHDRGALREHRRHAQMIFQDPTGALNARQTIYEAVAEGVRIQQHRGRRGDSSWRTRSRARACARRRASSRATRTRSRAASASA